MITTCLLDDPATDTQTWFIFHLFTIQCVSIQTIKRSKFAVILEVDKSAWQSQRGSLHFNLLFLQFFPRKDHNVRIFDSSAHFLFIYVKVVLLLFWCQIDLHFHELIGSSVHHISVTQSPTELFFRHILRNIALGGVGSDEQFVPLLYFYVSAGRALELHLLSNNI